ncbi:MAG: hypothetical protein ACLR2E_24435 [Lachnospiraceae bacterium]
MMDTDNLKHMNDTGHDWGDKDYPESRTVVWPGIRRRYALCPDFRR